MGTLLGRRVFERPACVGVAEVPDRWELEQPLGVRPGVAGKFGDLRQAGADHGDGERPLHGLVQGRNERFQLRRPQELDFVEEQHDTSTLLLRGLAEDDEKVSEVMLEIAAIRQVLGSPRQCLDVWVRDT